MDERDDSEAKDQSHDLLATGPRVVNVGLDMFAATLTAHGTPVVHVQWSPPAGGDPRLAGLLDKLRS